MSGIHVHQLPRWCASCGYRLTSHSTNLCRPCLAWSALTDEERSARMERSLARLLHPGR